MEGVQMGLSIFLELKPYTTPDLEIESRLNIASEVVKFYANYFTPTSVEVWRNAPAESLGGSHLKDMSFSKSEFWEDFALLRKELAAYNWETRADLILKIIGNWTIGKETIAGFMNVNNKSTWRSTYGDVEANIYADDKQADLVNFIKSVPELERQLVDYFLIEFAKSVEKEPLKINVMYFGVGAPSKYEIDSVTGVYYGSGDALLGDCFRTISAEQGETVTNTFNPYRQKFLISSLNDIPAFRQFLEEAFMKCHIVRAKTGSIALVGRDLQSFKLLYAELASKILEPLAKQLPNKLYLTKIIKDAVESKGKMTQVKLTKEE
jgi:hypothetical protein